MTVTFEMNGAEREALLERVRLAETVEQLRDAVLALTVLVLEMNQCCEGGPQGGHAWNCPKCPD